MNYYRTKHRVFISHYRGDRKEVDDFIKRFATQEKVFKPYVLGANNNDDFINSNNPDYVMSQIREKYLKDSTVTIVLIGSCTHSRRYVDWEIKSSIRRGSYRPNGLIGIILPSQGNSAYLPPRLKDNWSKDSNCYASYYAYPKTSEQLASWIEDAYNARTKRADLIKNTQDMMKYNTKCKICGVTH